MYNSDVLKYDNLKKYLFKLSKCESKNQKSIIRKD